MIASAGKRSDLKPVLNASAGKMQPREGRVKEETRIQHEKMGL